MDLPDAAQALLALPPARFAAERKAVAARLAAERDPAAPRVRKLRRPLGLAWVLNRLARERPREVAHLLDAGDQVRAGTRRAVSGAGAGALRAAEQSLRDRARALRLEAEGILAAEGRTPSPAAVARVELLLRVAATGGEAEALRQGELLREPEAGGSDLSGFTIVAGGRGSSAISAGPTPARPARAGGEAVVEARTAKAARAVEARAARARERAEREARTRMDRETRERRRALDAARAEASRADRRVLQEARRAEELARHARDARDRATAAKAEADRLHARVFELERAR
jgi:hypothetical protein